MPNIDLEQVEASLKAAKRKSQRRGLLFILAIVLVWGATYWYTKGEFRFFSKKIEVVDTLVIVQTAELDSLRQINRGKDTLISLLGDSLQKLNAALTKYTGKQTAAQVDNRASRLLAELRRQELERKRREQILLDRQREYENLKNAEFQQGPPKVPAGQ